MAVNSIAMDLGLTWRVDIVAFTDTFKYFIEHITFDLE